jgi:PAS domain S-box-containing protein
VSFELGHLFFAGVVYLLILFLIAYATEQGWIPERITRHPATYVLSLGVYATSWSFYGSVGFAGSQGFNFLTIYLGTTFAFILVPILLTPLLRLTRDYQLMSLADVLAFRYRSQTAGVLVTLFMLLGAFPYIALQIQAVTESVQILTQEAAPHILALGFCVTLILFAILFGARHVSPRGKHEGLVVAIAFESLVKLSALCMVGLYAIFNVFGGFDGLDAWLGEHPEALEALYAPVREGPWTTLLLLSFCAAFLLPRQFHMAVTENMEVRSVFSATWGFPLFLLLLNLFIPAILWAGTLQQTVPNPDYYVLGITLTGESRIFTTLAFLGGISAASGMMIVTTLALASMCLNHLLLPASYPDPDLNLYKWLLWGRRTLIAVIILAGYGFYLVLERNQGLAQLGLISFVAVAQFLPGMVGLLYWSRATRAGFIAGLSGGGTVWAVTLLLPLLERSGFVHTQSEALRALQMTTADPWSFSTFMSLSVNFALFVTISLLTRPSAEEKEAARACQSTPLAPPTGVVLGAASPEEFKSRLARILGEEAAESEVAQALRDLDMEGLERNPSELRRLRERIERNLSGLMGPMLARMIVDERLQMDPGARTVLADNIRFIEERLAHSHTRLQGVAAELDNLRRYHQQILLDLPLGVCSLGPDRNVVSWNLAMEILSGISARDAGGASVTVLPAPWSRLFTEFLDTGDQHVHKVRVEVDGRARWFNLHKAAIQDPSAPGETGGVVLLIEDLTNLQTLEAELAHSERLASIGRLAAGVAHEIGNPVTGIACLAQNLESETGDDYTRDTSQQILQQTKRIGDIVQSLVSFSHTGSISTGSFAPLDLHDCIEEAARLVQLSRAAKEVVCQNSCPLGIEIIGDQPRLLQVFVNLLTNACDASKPGDTVEITASTLDGNVLVNIIDNGVGIPESMLDQIFEPFVTTKPPGQGTGLGLALVYSIVQDHDGTVSFQSRPGAGTCAILRLPANPNATESPVLPEQALSS